MTPTEAGVVLNVLVAAFPGRIMSKDTTLVYARFLADVPLDIGVSAAAQWIARCKAFPSIAELRELCDQRSGNGPPDADRAFAEVMRAVGRWGIYAEPQFSHIAIRQAVEAITWREICLSEHAPSLRAHFAKAYDAAKKRTADPGHAKLVEEIRNEVHALVGGGRKELKA